MNKNRKILSVLSTAAVSQITKGSTDPTMRCTTISVGGDNKSAIIEFPSNYHLLTISYIYYIETLFGTSI